MKRVFSGEDHQSLLNGAILQFKLALAVSLLTGDEGFEFPYLGQFSWGQHFRLRAFW